jgi:hypothetical protein
VFGFAEETGTVKLPLSDGVYQNLIDDREITVRSGEITFDGNPIIIAP